TSASPGFGSKRGTQGGLGLRAWFQNLPSAYASGARYRARRLKVPKQGEARNASSYVPRAGSAKGGSKGNTGGLGWIPSPPTLNTVGPLKRIVSAGVPFSSVGRMKRCAPESKPTSSKYRHTVMALMSVSLAKNV